jgi:hypothetical protein
MIIKGRLLRKLANLPSDDIGFGRSVESTQWMIWEQESKVLMKPLTIKVMTKICKWERLNQLLSHNIAVRNQLLNREYAYFWSSDSNMFLDTHAVRLCVLNINPDSDDHSPN